MYHHPLAIRGQSLHHLGKVGLNLVLYVLHVVYKSIESSVLRVKKMTRMIEKKK